jgi:hypothetical protein
VVVAVDDDFDRAAKTGLPVIPAPAPGEGTRMQRA